MPNRLNPAALARLIRRVRRLGPHKYGRNLIVTRHGPVDRSKLNRLDRWATKAYHD